MKKFITRFTILYIFLTLVSRPVYAQYSDEGSQLSGISPLMIAVNSKDVDGVKFFSTAGRAVLNKKNIGGATALHIASRNNDLEIVKILIGSGADVNSSDNYGWTPLMRAASVAGSEVVSELLISGADATPKNSANETAIIHSANSTCSPCMNSILTHLDEKKMNEDFLNGQLEEAFLIANRKGDAPTKEILTQYRNNMGKEPALANDDLSVLPVTRSGIRTENGKMYFLKKKPVKIIPNKKPAIIEQDLTSIKSKNYLFVQGESWSPEKTNQNIDLKTPKSKKTLVSKTETYSEKTTIKEVGKAPKEEGVYKELNIKVDEKSNKIEIKENTVKKKTFNISKNKDETAKIIEEKTITVEKKIETIPAKSNEKKTFHFLKPEDEGAATKTEVIEEKEIIIKKDFNGTSQTKSFRFNKPDDQ